ncbi:MAG: bifunctional diaminohydroxyphosphoribosylaminopyrimidine deaminase/5-amino-6-(5-phosphoribosylamino)uracil reductase RibD [Gemmatimonadota bacterium]|nr:bifunctional diaminohydroxyphosphoribosylaminopyrimidine deaminase/5-amino-6-(5-phosphoribosylamino)uracil reductase RibD [Gemmatimonadota bacterium]MDE2986081.1 bifunctional diaminohydroxyphosphoribosylaminopyrimidine deaminase/5-amino-6-(5-phosphoribosylamino)uracil reductase RibD [Gemmatimonadota bacterium]
MSAPLAGAAGGDRLSATDRAFLGRSVELGRKGWGRVHPNPMVGAVVARAGVTLAEAHHAEFGGPHAEAAALAELGERARGATLYSSLEPCAHTGKTPPCAEAIRAAGIERVVYWAAEPGAVEGGGGAWLRRRGVRVAGPCGDVAGWAAENPVFFHAARSERPFVALKLAVSLDGRIAPRGGRRVWLTGPEARSEVHRLRAGFDAILVGTRTWKADDPMLTARGAVTPRVPPRPVLLDRRGEAVRDLRALRGDGAGRAIVVTAPGAAGRVEERLGGRGEVVAVPAGTRGLELAALMEALAGRGVGSVFCEGGGVLAASLLAEGLADRLYLFVAPVVVGGGGVPAFPVTPGDRPEDVATLMQGWQPRLDPVRFGDDTLIVLDRGG